jgi:chemotaxis protein MotA
MADEEKTKPAKSKVATRVDFATIGGIVLALGAIIGGLVLEGGKLTDIAQVTAAMIVLGGTIGAVMVTSPIPALIAAAKGLKDVFFEQSRPPQQAIDEIIGYATKARKNSIVSLESDLPQIQDPFLRKTMTLAVDGTELQELRNMMELEIAQHEHHREGAAKVFEAAGGYAPTIGIIGAVLGLIQVMKHLENIEEVGRGIAVAFVATVYGVASANLFFLPAASKLKARLKDESRERELTLEGVCSIVEGMNPKLIQVKLEAYAAHQSKAPKKAAAPAVEAAQPASAGG